MNVVGAGLKLRRSEISMAMIARRPGTWLCDRPIAASVPSVTEITVAIGAMISEFLNDRCHSLLVKKSC